MWAAGNSLRKCSLLSLRDKDVYSLRVLLLMIHATSCGFRKRKPHCRRSFFSLIFLYLLLQRQGFLPGLLEPLLAELPDLAAGHLEDLAQGRVGGLRGVVGLAEEATVLEPEDVVDLLIVELLHF